MADDLWEYTKGKSHVLNSDDDRLDKYLKLMPNQQQVQFIEDQNYKPGFIESGLHNFAGGMETSGGGLLDAISMLMKANAENEDSGMYGAGKWLENEADYLNKLGQKNAQRYGTAPRFENMSTPEALTSWDYWSDPRGAWADTTQGAGSSAQGLAAGLLLSKVAPVAALSGALGLGAKAGMEKVAPAVLSKVLPKALQRFTPTLSGMATDAAEALANNAIGMGTLPVGMEVLADPSENKQAFYQQARLENPNATQQELDKIVASKWLGQSLDEVPETVLADVITGGLVGGAGKEAIGGASKSMGKRAFANLVALGADMLGEGFQETGQTISGEKALGKPHGNLLNPFSYNTEESAAGRAGFFGAGLFGGGSAVKNTVFGENGNNDNSTPPEYREGNEGASNKYTGRTLYGTDLDSVTDEDGGYQIEDPYASHIVDLVEQNLKHPLPRNWIYAQMMHESGGIGNSEISNDEHHNHAGIKVWRDDQAKVPGGTDGTGGDYMHFDSDEEFAKVFAGTLNQYEEDGLFDAGNIGEYARALKHGGYFDDGKEGNDEEEIQNYAEGMDRFVDGKGTVRRGASNRRIADNLPISDESKLADWSSTQDDYDDYRKAYENIINGGVKDSPEEYLRLIAEANPKNNTEDENKANKALQSKDADEIAKVAEELGYGKSNEVAEVPLKRIMAQAYATRNVDLNDKGVADAFAQTDLGKQFTRMGDTQFKAPNDFRGRPEVKQLMQKLFYGDRQQARVGNTHVQGTVGAQTPITPQGQQSGTPTSSQTQGTPTGTPTGQTTPTGQPTGQTTPTGTPTGPSTPTGQPTDQTQGTPTPQGPQPGTSQPTTPQAQMPPLDGRDIGNLRNIGEALIKKMKDNKLPFSEKNMRSALASNNIETVKKAVGFMHRHLTDAGVDVSDVYADNTDAQSEAFSQAEQMVNNMLADFKDKANSILADMKQGQVESLERVKGRLDLARKEADHDIAKVIADNKAVNAREKKELAKIKNDGLANIYDDTMQQAKQYFDNQSAQPTEGPTETQTDQPSEGTTEPPNDTQPTEGNEQPTEQDEGTNAPTPTDEGTQTEEPTDEGTQTEEPTDEGTTEEPEHSRGYAKAVNLEEEIETDFDMDADAILSDLGTDATADEIRVALGEVKNDYMESGREDLTKMKPKITKAEVDELVQKLSDYIDGFIETQVNLANEEEGAEEPENGDTEEPETGEEGSTSTPSGEKGESAPEAGSAENPWGDLNLGDLYGDLGIDIGDGAPKEEAPKEPQKPQKGSAFKQASKSLKALLKEYKKDLKSIYKDWKDGLVNLQQVNGAFRDSKAEFGEKFASDVRDKFSLTDEEKAKLARDFAREAKDIEDEIKEKFQKPGMTDTGEEQPTSDTSKSDEGVTKETEEADDEEMGDLGDFGDEEDSDDDLQKALEEARDMISKSARRLNSGVDPTVIVPMLKIGRALLKKGITKFKQWSSELAKLIGQGVKRAEDNVRRFAGAVWTAIQTIRKFPKGTMQLNGNEKALQSMIKAVGALWVQGVRDLDTIKERILGPIRKNNPEMAKKFEPMVETAYNSIKRYYDDLEAETNDGSNGNDEGQSEGTSGEMGENQSGAGNAEGTGKDQSAGTEDDGGKGSVPNGQQPNAGGSDEGNTSDAQGTQNQSGGQPGAGGHGSGVGSKQPGSVQETEGSGKSNGNGGEHGTNGQGAGPEGSENGTGNAGVRTPSGRPVAGPGNRGTGRRVTREVLRGSGFKVLDNGNIVITDPSQLTLPTFGRATGEDALSALLGRTNNNIAAYKAIREWQESGEAHPTPEQKFAMAKFSGWAGYQALLSKESSTENPVVTALQDYFSPEDIEKIRTGEWTTELYTKPIIATKIWEAMKRLGFKGGKVLNVSAGIGNLLSFMPEELNNESTVVTAIEGAENVSDMLKGTHEGVHVFTQEYDEHAIGDNNYDLIIGDVNNSSHELRDHKVNIAVAKDLTPGEFSVLKGLQQLKPNGVLAMCVSSTVMDDKNSEARMYMAKEAKLVGAFRLPSYLFGRGLTKRDKLGPEDCPITKDILIFKKREKPVNAIEAGYEPWVDCIPTDITDGTVTAFENAYFVANPDNVLGVPYTDSEVVTVETGKESEETTATVKGFDVRVRMDYGQDDVRNNETEANLTNFLKDKLTKAINSLPENIIGESEAPEDYAEADTTKDLGGVYINSNDELVLRDGMKEVPVGDIKKLNKGLVSEVKGLVRLAEKYDELREADLAGRKDAKQKREACLEAVEEFIKSYGPYIKSVEKINKKENKKYMSVEKSKALTYLQNIGDTPKVANLQALLNSNGDIAPILYDDIITRAKDFDETTVEGASAKQLNDGKRYLDVDAIAETTFMNRETVIDELADKDIAYNNGDGQYEMATTFLSGNVVGKLKDLKRAQKMGVEGLDKSIKALEKVQPKRVPIGSVSLNIGAAWVPLRYYQHFLYAISNGIDNADFLDDASDGVVASYAETYGELERDDGKYLIEPGPTVDSTTTFSDRYKTTTEDLKTAVIEMFKENHKGEALPLWMKEYEGNTTDRYKFGDHVFIRIGNESGLTIRQAMLAALNNTSLTKTIKVYVPTGDELDGFIPQVKQYVDVPEEFRHEIEEILTKVLRAKVEMLNNDFRSWMTTHNLERRNKVEDIYNDTVNIYTPADFHGDDLVMEGMVSKEYGKPISPRKHQSAFVMRGLMHGRGIAAHDVGTGKTMIMAMLAMKARRLGLAKKPVIFAAQQNSASIVSDFKRFFPYAKILFISTTSETENEKSQKAKDTKRLLELAEYGDWDAVVLPHSQVGNVTFTPDNLRNVFQPELSAIQSEALTYYRENPEDRREKPLQPGMWELTTKDKELLAKNKRPVKIQKPLPTEVQKLIADYKVLYFQILKASEDIKRKNAIVFDRCGFDLTFVDEAQVFKNGRKRTSHNNRQVRGMDLSESADAIAMQRIAQYMNMAHDNKGMFLFTGTLISNSIPEIFIHLKNVIPDVMRESYNENLDDFLNNFTNIESALAPDEAGTPQMIMRLEEFINITELRRIMMTVTDIQHREEMPEFQHRKTKNGKGYEDDLTEAERDELLNGWSEKPVGLPNLKTVNVVIKKTKVSAEIPKVIAEFIKKIKGTNDKVKRAINRECAPLLRIGKLMPIWGATVATIHPSLREEPNSKVKVLVDNVMKHYNESDKACQAIFLEDGYGKVNKFRGKTFKRNKDGSVERDRIYETKFPSYNISQNIINKLVLRGIPEEQIAIVTGETKDPALREFIAKQVASGDIRVVIGSAATIGVGVNMQDNLRAIHHFDIPYTPGDKEQEDGRAYRQGNHWNTVFEYRYINPGFDGKKWSLISFKDLFIRALMDKNNTDRIINAESLQSDASGDENASAVNDLVETFSIAQGDERYVREESLKSKLKEYQGLEKMSDEQITKARMEIPKMRQEIAKINDEIIRLGIDSDTNNEHKNDKNILLVPVKRADGRDYTVIMSNDEKARLNALVQNYKNKKESLENKQAEAEKAYQEAVKQQSETKESLNGLQKAVKEATEQADTASKNVDTAQAKVTANTDAIAKANEQLKNAEEKKQPTKEIKAKIASLKKETTALNGELREAKKQLTQKNADVAKANSELAKANKQLDEVLPKRIKSAEQDIEDAKTKLSGLVEPTFYHKETIKGQEFFAITDKSVADRQLWTAINAQEAKLVDSTSPSVLVAKFRGFDIRAEMASSGHSRRINLRVKGKNSYYVEPSESGKSATLDDVRRTLSNFAQKVKNKEKELAEVEDKLNAKEANANAENPWTDLVNKFKKNLAKVQKDIKENPIIPPEWLKLTAPKGMAFIDAARNRTLYVSGWSTKDSKYYVKGQTDSDTLGNHDYDEDEDREFFVPIEDVLDTTGENIFTEEDINRDPNEEYLDPEDDSTDEEVETAREKVAKFFESNPDFSDWPGAVTRDVTGDEEAKGNKKREADRDNGKIGEGEVTGLYDDSVVIDGPSQTQGGKERDVRVGRFGEPEVGKVSDVLTPAGRAAYGSILNRMEALQIPTLLSADLHMFATLMALHAETMSGIIADAYNQASYSPIEYTKAYAIGRDDAQFTAEGYQATKSMPIDYSVRDRAIISMKFVYNTTPWTLLHEFMHMMEKELYSLSKQGHTPQKIKDAWYALAQWLYHDKLARSGQVHDKCEELAQSLPLYLAATKGLPEPIEKVIAPIRPYLLQCKRVEDMRTDEYNTAHLTIPDNIRQVFDTLFMYRIEDDNDVKHSSEPSTADLRDYKFVPKEKLTTGQRMMQSLGDALGVKINYVDAPDVAGVRSVFFAGNQIVVNRNANVPANQIIFHEFTHWMRKNNRALYDDMVKGLKISKERMDMYRKGIRNGAKLSEASIVEEMVADAVAKSNLRFRMLQEMISSDISTGKKIIGGMLYAWEKVKAMVNEFIGNDTAKALQEGLKPHEISLMDAKLKQAVCNLKKNGKPVFKIDKGEVIDVESGRKATLLSYSSEPEPQWSASADPKDSSDIRSITDFALQKLAHNLGLDDVLKKAGLKAGERVTVQDSPTDNGPSFLQRWFSSPTVLAKKYPHLQFFVDLAVAAQEAQEKLRAHFTEIMNSVDDMLKERKNKEDRKALIDLLLDGDANSEEYFDEDLKDEGYSDNVIKAYKTIRMALNEAYNRINDVRQMAEIKLKKDMSKQELEEIEKHPFKMVIYAHDNGDGTFEVSYRQPRLFTRTETLSEDELDSLRKDKNVYVVSATPIQQQGGISGDKFFKVKYESQISPLGRLKGYIPHIFHGFFIVQKMKDDDGKVTGYKILKSYDSLKEATRVANEFADNNPDAEIIVSPKLFHIPGSAQQAAIMGDEDYTKTMNKLINDLGISASDAKELIRKKPRRRFFGHMLQRKGASGFDDNVLKALRMYFNQASRYCAMDEFKRKSITHFEKVYGDFFLDDRKLSKEAIYARNYIHDMNGNPTMVEEMLNDLIKQTPILRDFITDKINGRPALSAAHAITYPMSIAKLGLLNFGSAIINLSQLFNMAGALDAGFTQGYHYLNYGLTMYNKAKSNPAMMHFLMETLGLKYSMNMTVANGYSKAEVAGKMLGQSFWLFNKFDGCARAVTLFGAYKKALDNGMTKAEAIDYAKEINRRVNVDSSVADAPDLFRRFGPVGTVLLQFQKFPVKQLEFFGSLLERGYKRGGAVGATKEFVTYTWPYFLASGMYGIPFVGLMNGVLSALGAAISGDDDWDWEKEMKKLAKEKLGENSKIANAFFYGAGAVIPGVDVGRRIGIGDYGSTLLNSNIADQNGTHGLFGTVARMTTLGSTITQAYNQFVENGNVIEGIRAINPSIGNVLTAVNGEVHTTKGRLKYRYDGAYDRLLRALGFTPINERISADESAQEYDERRQGKIAKSDAIYDFLKAESNHDTAEMKRLASELNSLGVKPSDVKYERERRNKTNKEYEENKKTSKKKNYSLKDYQ